MARKNWGITEFRLCQEGALNAVMDKRDVVCVMPTGECERGIASTADSRLT